MKYLLLLFFLAGCTTVSDYRQGCLDGYIHALKDNEDRFSDYLKDPKNEAFVRGNVDKSVCEPADDRRTQKRMFRGNGKGGLR